MAETSAGSCSCRRCASDTATDSHAADPDPTCYCSLDGVIDVIRRKHAMGIVSHLGAHGAMQYSDLRDALNVSSEATLSDNLKRLADVDLVDRTVDDAAPPQVEYALTERGRQLKQRLRPLLQWADNQ